jgi:hypothetical protein
MIKGYPSLLTLGLHISVVVCTQAYQALVDKHSQLARKHGLLLEHAGDAAVSNQVEELLAVRQQLAELLPRYDEACNTVAELRWASAPCLQLHCDTLMSGCINNQSAIAQRTLLSSLVVDYDYDCL